jgi:hypothetical protein
VWEYVEGLRRANEVEGLGMSAGDSSWAIVAYRSTISPFSFSMLAETHGRWSGRGLEVVARSFAERIERFESC